MAWIADGNDDHQSIFDKDFCIANQPGIAGFHHIRHISRGEDIGRRAIGNLLLQQLRSIKVIGDRDIGMQLVIGRSDLSK